MTKRLSRKQIVDRIEHDSDGWWVYLRPGFIVRDEGTHAIVEDTKRAALDKLYLVQPCHCAECLQLLAKAVSL